MSSNKKVTRVGSEGVSQRDSAMEDQRDGSVTVEDGVEIRSVDSGTEPKDSISILGEDEVYANCPQNGCGGKKAKRLDVRRNTANIHGAPMVMGRLLCLKCKRPFVLTA